MDVASLNVSFKFLFGRLKLSSLRSKQVFYLTIFKESLDGIAQTFHIENVIFFLQGGSSWGDPRDYLSICLLLGALIIAILVTYARVCWILFNLF
jgi:hypothetical protein